jgi:integrase/recombinase XerD
MKWAAKTINYKKEQRISVVFDNNADSIARIKKLSDARWSAAMGCWHLPDTEENRIRFKLPLATTLLPNTEGIKAIEDFQRWLQSKRYSDNTIKTYCDALKSFFVFFRAKNLHEITNEDILMYNTEYILKKNLSASYQNQIVNAIKLYFNTIQDKRIVCYSPKFGQVLINKSII